MSFFNALYSAYDGCSVVLANPHEAMARDLHAGVVFLVHPFPLGLCIFHAIHAIIALHGGSAFLLAAVVFDAYSSLFGHIFALGCRFTGIRLKLIS